MQKALPAWVEWATWPANNWDGDGVDGIGTYTDATRHVEPAPERRPMSAPPVGVKPVETGAQEASGGPRTGSPRYGRSTLMSGRWRALELLRPVPELVAEGLSNPEVAERSYLSPAR